AVRGRLWWHFRAGRQIAATQLRRRNVLEGVGHGARTAVTGAASAKDRAGAAAAAAMVFSV
ncbi:hypothetical protein L9G15_27130, partial [Shewanella sp. A3A]|nr:hypothetical protein [Shewanella ferrihydritica]